MSELKKATDNEGDSDNTCNWYTQNDLERPDCFSADG